VGCVLCLGAALAFVAGLVCKVSSIITTSVMKLMTKRVSFSCRALSCISLSCALVAKFDNADHPSTTTGKAQKRLDRHRINNRTPPPHENEKHEANQQVTCEGSDAKTKGQVCDDRICAEVICSAKVVCKGNAPVPPPTSISIIPETSAAQLKALKSALEEKDAKLAQQQDTIAQLKLQLKAPKPPPDIKESNNVEEHPCEGGLDSPQNEGWIVCKRSKKGEKREANQKKGPQEQVVQCEKEQSSCSVQQVARHVPESSKQRRPHSPRTESDLDQWLEFKRTRDYDAADQLRKKLRARGLEPDVERPLGYVKTSPSRSCLRQNLRPDFPASLPSQGLDDQEPRRQPKKEANQNEHEVSGLTTATDSDASCCEAKHSPAATLSVHACQFFPPTILLDSPWLGSTNEYMTLPPLDAFTTGSSPLSQSSPESSPEIQSATSRPQKSLASVEWAPLPPSSLTDAEWSLPVKKKKKKKQGRRSVSATLVALQASILGNVQASCQA